MLHLKKDATTYQNKKRKMELSSYFTIEKLFWGIGALGGAYFFIKQYQASKKTKQRLAHPPTLNNRH